MSLINIVIVLFLLLIIIMTFVTEPKLSVQYYKAVGDSVGVVIGKSKDVIGSWVQKHNQGVDKDGKL